ncbi:peptidase S8/S53 domain-containing protein [Gymnopilus junonius]|uniref:Peptidase S8/S53 domain-containing protein n=1 Tax=Gymnopilus junonius TaxID=109634 RepID=A0A9P5NWI8_GYMJU|nr:peptidase S8/S53 domain-containing protein [Gymnopilus junonius]
MNLLRAFLASLFLLVAAGPARRSYDTHNYYVLHHSPAASGASLPQVIQAFNVELVEQAGELQDYWLVRQLKPQDHLSVRDSSDPVLSLFNALKAQAFSSLDARSQETDLARRVVSSVDYLSLQILRRRVKRAPPPISPPPVTSSRNVAARFGIQDPMFPQQWHLVNDEFPQYMMNVTGVWEMGFKGKGVISSLVDDGLDYESEDLSDNFDEDDSYDFNDHEDLPTPKNFDDHHGTRCAGQIAAQKNNVCGIGIAHESKVAGVRILSGPITDADEAAALNYGFQNVSIYSCSWGPPDNGMSMEGPNHLIQKAVVNGINNGRGGKGSIFVFASGNGAAHGDQCNFDGYTNSIYSVTVSAVDYKGLHPYYSEPCAANMIVAYSSGSGRHIVTTDKGKNKCATTHGGTSAAAPNAVGVFALALQARPDLTWRDIQYLCVETAGMINADDPDWEPIANGRKYSYKYGFGVLDGYTYVKAAQSWKLVKPQAWFKTKTIRLGDGTFSNKIYSGGTFIPSGGLESKMTITQDMLTQNNVEALEHINVKVWIDHAIRGQVEVEIVSPNGIKSVLAGPRQADKDTSGYPGWAFMSVKHWGESPVGDWVLRVKDQNTPEKNGTLLGWNMILWGSSIDPMKATKYEVPLVDDVLPPPEETSPVLLLTSTVSATATRQHPKPTEHLPPDHGDATGEKTKPAFIASTTFADTQASPTSGSPLSNAPDLGWFSDMSSLVTGQKWFFVALGAVSIFGIAVGAFFWRRRVSMRSGNYTSLNNENDVSMTALGTSISGGPRTTRELYDAFGEVSDEDDDETTALQPQQARSTGGLGFHSGFLDDNDPPTAAGPTPQYHDEPENNDVHAHSKRQESTPEEGTASPAGSGDGSWGHASKD